MPAPTWNPGRAIVYVGIWAKKSGVWQLVSTDYVYVKGGTGEATTYSSFSVNKSFQLGSGIEAFGLTIEGVEGGFNPGLSDFVSVAWTAPGAASSTRTATPSGRSGKVTVRPQ